MRHLAGSAVAALILVAGSAEASPATSVSAALRITGNGPLAVVGTGWKPFEHVFVNARIGAVTKKAWPVAGRSGYWRIVVRTAPIGCDRVVVTARGPRTGLLTARRMFGACPPPAA